MRHNSARSFSYPYYTTKSNFCQCQFFTFFIISVDVIRHNGRIMENDSSGRVLAGFFVSILLSKERKRPEGGDGLVKGAQKQMIVVKTADSRYFDEAYFVLRREVKGARGDGHDMLAEANKILEECGAESHGRRRMPRAWLLFLGGLLCGALPTLAVFLILL